MKQILVIPARMTGKRLPGKPLISIFGKPMLLRVWEQCKKVINKKDIFVATEDKIIEKFCLKSGINVINTGNAPTAIYRIGLFSKIIKAKNYIVVNGDEPLANIKDLKKLIKYGKKFPNRVAIGEGPCSKYKYNDKTKAKVIVSKSGKVLYTSRLSLPYSEKNYTNYAKSAIWYYSFNKKALDHYIKNYNYVKTDKLEGLEINGMIECDIDVYAIKMIGDSWAVDTKKDITYVEKILNEKILKKDRR